MTGRRILVWHWGRRGAGPRFAVALAEALDAQPGTTGLLSLSAQAEILLLAPPPACVLAQPTYHGLPGFLARLALAPFGFARLVRQLRALRLDGAICAMPAPLDLLMMAALRRLGVPYGVVVHDADAHPGDGVPLQMALQRRLVRGAAFLVALSAHVADRLTQQGLAARRPLLRAAHPPFHFGPAPPPPRAHGGPFRLLSFGRLLPYKGLDLLAETLSCLGPRDDLCVRVVGRGPEGEALAALRTLPGVRVENRWVPEPEIAALLAWADGVVLSHREASQSGVAAAALAAGRWVVATRVGGLAEQLQQAKLARLAAPDAASLAEALRGLLEEDGIVPAADDAAAGWHRLAAQLVPMMDQARRRQPA